MLIGPGPVMFTPPAPVMPTPAVPLIDNWAVVLRLRPAVPLIVIWAGVLSCTPVWASTLACCWALAVTFISVVMATSPWLPLRKTPWLPSIVILPVVDWIRISLLAWTVIVFGWVAILI